MNNNPLKFYIMKKYFIVTFITFSALFFSSCEKLCSCSMPGEEPKIIEISPSENCADYTGPKNGNCQD